MRTFPLVFLVLCGVVGPAIAGPRAPASARPSSAPAARPTGASPAGQQVVLRPLWGYDKELGLSATQVTILKTAISQMKERLMSLRKAEEAERKILSSLIFSDADVAVIRAKARQILDIELDLRMLDIETAQKMRKTLTPPQLATWRKIQAAHRPTSPAVQGRSVRTPARGR